MGTVDKDHRECPTCILGCQRLLGRLGPLDDGLDELLLFPARFVVTPPLRPLVLAVEAQMSACPTFRFALITLLPSQPAGKAPWARISHSSGRRSLGGLT
jgi:hypothetical protein